MPKFDTIVSIKPEPDEKGRRKGVVRPRIEDEAWRRRIKHNIHVRYFDPAQYANGTERPFFYDLDFAPVGYDNSGWTGGLPSGANTCVPWPPFTDKYGYLDPYNAYLLDGDREEWATTYKEIKADENIQFFTPYITDYVEGLGYPVPDHVAETNSYHFSFGDGGWEQGWLNFHTLAHLPASHWQKITRTPDFADDHFEFQQTGNCNIFLAPSPRFWEGRAVSFTEKYPTYLSGPFSKRQNLFLANHFLRTVPRAALHHADFDTWWSYIIDGEGPTPGGVFPSNMATPIKQFMWNLFMGLPESRSKVVDAEAWEIDGLSNDPNDYVIGGSFPNTYSGGSFIFDPDNWGGSTDNPRSWLDRPLVRWFKWYRPVGMLAAIIHKKDGEDPGWYYVWRTVATTINKPYPSAAFPTIPSIASADLGARV